MIDKIDYEKLYFEEKDYSRRLEESNKNLKYQNHKLLIEVGKTGCLAMICGSLIASIVWLAIS